MTPGTPQQSQPTLDFGRPFAYVFEDPEWIKKILIGGLFYLCIVIIIGPFFVAGYCARLARNVIAGEPRPLPEWDDLGAYFSEGAMLAAISLIYSAPIFLALGLAIGPSIVAGILKGNGGGDAAATMAGGFSGCIGCLIMPLSLALSLWLPGALMMAIVERRFSAAFEFGRIWLYIKDNLANYLLAFVVYYVARFAAGLGFLLLCIGLFFTAFWALLVATYAYADVYRRSLLPRVSAASPVILPPS